MLGEKLRSLREDNAYGIDELAAKLGVRRETIWHWENNKTKPTNKYLRAIAKLFKVDVKTLTK